MGHSWVSLQHVGVVIGLRTGTLPQTFANTLTTYISNTLGYHQRVEVKDMIPGGPPIELWEWNNDKKHVCKTITELETRLTTHTSFPRVATSSQSTPYKVCTVLPQPVGLPQPP